ncbi:MAG: peptide deformylase [Candidatus Wallbacteria bacterium]|nr:peptide deformylase [Candidatus Wallbacteria bacterium]
MPVLPVLTYPAPELRRVSSAIEVYDGSADALAADLVQTVNSFPGCVGIAAPQTGDARRLIAIDASRHRKPVANRGLLVLANPVVLAREGSQIFREGCLSLPDYTANVLRATAVTVRGIDRAGEELTLTAEGFEAVVLQHEIDHLDGVLFIDRVASLKRDIFRRQPASLR